MGEMRRLEGRVKYDNSKRKPAAGRAGVWDGVKAAAAKGVAVRPRAEARV